MIKTKFETASDAFNYFFPKIMWDGVKFDNTMTLFNIGFYIEKPMYNHILAEHRNWNDEYAEAEWQWYLSGNPNVDKLGDIYGKVPEIWKRMVDSNNEVRSNYGWQWERNYQLDYVVTYRFKSKDGPWNQPLSIEASRTYTYDDSDILAKDEEEKRLVSGMEDQLIKTMATQISLSK